MILLTRLTPLRDPFQYIQSPPFRCGGKPNIVNLKRASFISFIHFERLSVSSFSFPIHLLLSSQYCTARRSIHTAAPKLPHVHLKRGPPPLPLFRRSLPHSGLLCEEYDFRSLVSFGFFIFKASRTATQFHSLSHASHSKSRFITGFIFVYQEARCHQMCNSP